MQGFACRIGLPLTESRTMRSAANVLIFRKRSDRANHPAPIIRRSRLGLCWTTGPSTILCPFLLNQTIYQALRGNLGDTREEGRGVEDPYGNLRTEITDHDKARP